MLVKTIKEIINNFKIVGYINDRDRLGHWWVAEMLLNAQSELLVNKRKAGYTKYKFSGVLHLPLMELYHYGSFRQD
jgi:hypothetical protein